MNVIIISTYIPQKCGIATYSNDLYKALKLSPTSIVNILAIVENPSLEYPKEAVSFISKDSKNDYIQNANFINENYDVCILEHEYGIFGGDSGDYILELINRLTIPLVTNFHTILSNPTKKQRSIMLRIIMISSKITVMTASAVELLTTKYNTEKLKIELIPHGVPVFNTDQNSAKEKLSFSSSKIIILSFGFLGEGKGFEIAIDAVVKIKNLNFIYIILGSTHPNVLRSQGETYRKFLQKKISDLEIEEKILMIDKFANEEELKLYLSACDIYITPYPNENQTSSGPLSFAVGAGAAVISTPYHYAKDLLMNDRGLFFNFNDSKALASILESLITNPTELKKYRINAKNHGKSMEWPIIGKKQKKILELTSNKHEK